MLQIELGRALNVMYRQLYSPPNKIVMFGPTSSPAAAACAEAAVDWNFTMVILESGLNKLYNIIIKGIVE